MIDADSRAPLTTLMLLRGWEEYARTGRQLSERSVHLYSRMLTALMADLKVELHEVTEEMLLAWLSPPEDGGTGRRRGQRPNGGGDGWNRTARLRALRHFYGWAVRRGHVPQDPTLMLTNPRPRKMRPRWIEKADILAILQAARTMSDRRVAPTLALMYYTGCRVGSLAGARREDVDLAKGELYWRVAKRGITYTSPLSDKALMAARRLIELADYTPPGGLRKNTLVGVGEERIRQWLTEACHRAKVKRVTPHQFRHSFGTHLATDPSVDIRTWVELMGHSNPGQFTRYAGVDRTGLRGALGNVDVDDDGWFG